MPLLILSYSDDSDRSSVAEPSKDADDGGICGSGSVDDEEKEEDAYDDNDGDGDDDDDSSQDEEQITQPQSTCKITHRYNEYSNELQL